MQKVGKCLLGFSYLHSLVPQLPSKLLAAARVRATAARTHRSPEHWKRQISDQTHCGPRRMRKNHPALLLFPTNAYFRHLHPHPRKRHLTWTSSELVKHSSLANGLPGTHKKDQIIILWNQGFEQVGSWVLPPCSASRLLVFTIVVAN